MHLQNIVFLVVAADRAACLYRHAGVATYGKLEFDNALRLGEGRIDVAEALIENGRLGRMIFVEESRIFGCVDDDRQSLGHDLDKVGRILGEIRIGCEHRGDRFADVAHAVARQHVLSVWFKLRQSGETKSDRRKVRDVNRGPHRVHARKLQRFFSVDTDQPAVRDRRAHDAHVKLARERDVGGEPAAAGQQRPIFKSANRAADEFAGGRHDPRISPAAARTDLMMFW